MNLFELASLDFSLPETRVPEWALGCFRRRSIVFFTGASDERTEVIWLQTFGLTADLRIQPDRPTTFDGASLEQLVALSAVEGGLASSHWDGQAMHWHDWVSFQTHAKWPEPGLLRRVGESLIEFAPSGAYVEDWRLQPSAPGPLIGLRLLEELDRETKRTLHRGGGLLVCGDHAALIRGRPTEPSWDGRVTDFVRNNARDSTALSTVFAFDAAYARREKNQYIVRAATSPWRQGKPLLTLSGFNYDPSRRLVIQMTEEDGRAIERRFTVDTMLPYFEAVRATDAAPEAAAWLQSEADTLLTHAR